MCVFSPPLPLTQTTETETANIDGEKVSAAEMKEIVTAYADKADVKQVQSTGLHVGGERFVVLKADERSLYGKKVRYPVPPCSDHWA